MNGDISHVWWRGGCGYGGDWHFATTAKHSTPFAAMAVEYCIVCGNISFSLLVMFVEECT